MRRSFLALFVAVLAALSLTACAGSSGRPFEAGNIPPGKTLSNECLHEDGKYRGPNCKLEDLKPGQQQVVIPDRQQHAPYGMAPMADPYSLPWMHGHQMVPLNGPVTGYKVCDQRGLHCTMPNVSGGPQGAPQWSVRGVFNN